MSSGSICCLVFVQSPHSLNASWSADNICSKSISIADSHEWHWAALQDQDEMTVKTLLEMQMAENLRWRLWSVPSTDVGDIRDSLLHHHPMNLQKTKGENAEVMAIDIAGYSRSVWSSKSRWTRMDHKPHGEFRSSNSHTLQPMLFVRSQPDFLLMVFLP